MQFFAECGECGRPFACELSSGGLEVGVALHKSLGHCHPENPLRGWTTNPVLLCTRIADDLFFVEAGRGFSSSVVVGTLMMALDCPLSDGLKSVAQEGLHIVSGVIKGDSAPLAEALRKLLEGILAL